MRDNLGKITRVLLWVMFAITALFIVFYFMNLDVIEQGIDTTWVSRVLRFSYVLVLIAVAGVVIAALFNFGRRLIHEPKQALISLIPLVLLVVVIFIASFMASDEIMQIQSYDGPDNIPSTQKAVGTGLITMYLLLGLAVLSIIGTAIAQLFK
ncbi:MAG: hypothetical protein U9N85_05500 [Bacteroidota bacterium]|nr:hypothetical protein [Bacteroidota bacterium]